MAYASKYYDPVKAHEYYEKHKKLKGRTSTKGLSEQGKQAAKYVKEQIREQKKAFNEKLKEQLKAKIAEIKERMKDAPKEERAEAIKALREWAKQTRQAGKEFYDKEYERELDNIKKDGKFLQGKKSRKKKKGK